MTLTPKQWWTVAKWLALSALLVAVSVAAWRWDARRLQARYDAGVAAENDRWTRAQVAAGIAAADRARAAGQSSASATDAARDRTTAAGARIEATTQSDVEEITNAHRDQPAPRCAPDGRPAAVPARVLDTLDAARARAGAARRRP